MLLYVILFSSSTTLDTFTVAQLFDLYTSTVTSLLDTMLPRRKVWTRLRPLAVWFDADCHRLRRRTRCLERRYRRTKEPSDRLAWIAQLRALHHLYHHKEAAHWEKLVSRNAKNPRRLWSSISGLLGRSSRSTEVPSFTANEFLQTLTDKIDRLRASTADAPPPSFTPTSTVFDGFRPITEADLRLVFTSANLKSCELDPLPPFIIYDILDDFAPFWSIYLIGPSPKVASLPHRNGLSSFPRLKSQTLTPTFALTIGQSQIYPFFPRLWNAWSLSSFFLILSNLVFFLLTSLALGLTTPRRLPSFLYFLKFTLLLIGLNSLFWLSMMSPQHSIWSITTFFCSVLKPLTGSRASLFVGSDHTYLKEPK